MIQVGKTALPFFLFILVAQFVLLVHFALLWTLRPSSNTLPALAQASSSIALMRYNYWTLNDNNTSDTSLNTRSVFGASAIEPVDSVCVIIRTFHRQSLEGLLGLVGSMLRSAELAHTKLQFVFADTNPGTPFKALPSIVAKINSIFGPNAKLSPRTFHNTVKYFPGFRPPDYGYIVADFIIDDILKSQDYSCKYMMLSNGDNLYTREFFPSVLTELRFGAKMVCLLFFGSFALSARTSYSQCFL